MAKKMVHRNDTLCPYCGKRWSDHPREDRREAGFYCTGRAIIAAKKTRTPRRALLRMLTMAEEMSNCNTYGEHNDDGEYQGVAQDVQRDLELVRRWLGAKKGT